MTPEGAWYRSRESPGFQEATCRVARTSRENPLHLPLRLVAASMVFVSLTACGGPEPEDLHPLDQMSISFENSPGRHQIQSVLDPVMEAYGVALTEENYSRAGSTLVAIRQEVGIPEMEVLDCMSRQRSRWGSRGFAHGAGLSAFTLQEVGACNPSAAGV